MFYKNKPVHLKKDLVHKSIIETCTLAASIVGALELDNA